MRYLVEDTYVNDGAAELGRLNDEVVDAEFVASYTDIETRRFFINLGGTEEMRKTKTGMIICKSVSADRSTIRSVRFTPVPHDPGATS